MSARYALATGALAAVTAAAILALPTAAEPPRDPPRGTWTLVIVAPHPVTGLRTETRDDQPSEDLCYEAGIAWMELAQAGMAIASIGCVPVGGEA